MLEVQVRLRERNQLTLPETVTAVLGAAPGDALLIAIDEGQPDVVQIRRLRDSYAGIAAGVFGASEQEAAEYLSGERESWGR